MHWVLHVDMDQFIAAVEIARHPELAGKPVIVGGNGDASERAVVATASYEAREFGVHSAMPLRVAARKCPDAVLLPSDPDAYDAASAVVMSTLRERASAVEVLGWDEAFVAYEGGDPEGFARVLMDAVYERTSLYCSVGIGDNKLRAKMATEFGKPAGMYRLTRDNWVAVMEHEPPDALWGIGRKTAKKLAEAGYRTVRELATAEPMDLAVRFGGKLGPWYRTLALGAGSTTVDPTPWVPKSRSRETTFQQNIEDPDRIRNEISLLARRVAVDVAEDGRPAARVAVKIRFAPFFTQTRSKTLPEPSSDPAVIEAAAWEILARFTDDRPVRLLGVRAEFPVTE